MPSRNIQNPLPASYASFASVDEEEQNPLPASFASFESPNQEERGDLPISDLPELPASYASFASPPSQQRYTPRTREPSGELEPQDEGLGVLGATLAAGESIRAGIISVLEGKGIEATTDNIKAAWSTDDPEVKDSFMQLLDEAFHKIRVAPEGTYNPVLSGLAKNVQGRAAVTTLVGLAGDIIVDPLSWLGGIVSGVSKVRNILSPPTKRARKRAEKIQENIKNRQARLVDEGMEVKVAGHKAYMEQTRHHTLLEEALDIKTAGAVRPLLNKPQLKAKYARSRPKTAIGKLTDKGFTSIGDLNRKLFHGEAGIDKFVQPLLSKMEEYSMVIADRLRMFEYETGTGLHKDLMGVAAWVKSFRTLPKAARIQLTKHLYNQDFTQALNIMGKVAGMADEFTTSVVPLLKTKGTQLARTNEELALLTNYFPRSVKDRKGLAKILGIDDSSEYHELLLKELLRKGRHLTPTEMADVLNRAVRKPSIESVTKKIGAEKARRIEKLDDSLMPYYETADIGILRHLREVNHVTKRREFFGKFAKIDDIEGVESSIGAVLREEVRAGRLAKSEMRDVEGLLKARFIGGEKGANALISGAKSAGYMMTIGNPFSAITQLGDLGTSAYLHGILNTAIQSVKVILGKKKIDFEEFGFDLMAELKDVSKSQAHLAFVFKWSGFRLVDVFGKNVAINASLAKWSKIGKQGDAPLPWWKYDSGKLSQEKQLRQRYKHSFDEARLNTLVDDFKSYGQGTHVDGKLIKGPITEDMRYVVFNDLIEAQPIVQSSLPVAYLNNPDARIAYQLKTFALKQLDIVRQRAFKKIKQGDVLGGTAELVRYGAIVGGANTGSETLKMAVRDWINGGDKLKELYENDEGPLAMLPALVVANTLKVWGFSSILKDKIFSGYWEGAATDLVMPPVIGTGGDVMAALTQQAEVMKGVRHLPIGGKVLYYMFGEDSSRFGKL